MEIAGNTCAACGQRVVFACDGKFCAQCGVVVHGTCDTQSTCSRCGGVYEIQQPPVVDVARDAILPRNLRPSNTAIPVAVAILGALLVLILLFLSGRLIC